MWLNGILELFLYMEWSNKNLLTQTLEIYKNKNYNIIIDLTLKLV